MNRVRTHTVVAGETLPMLALRFYGDPELHTLIATASGISGSDSVGAGRQLIVPDYSRY